MMIERARIADYIELCKPRVVALMVLTAIIAMLLASPSGTLRWQVLIYGSLGIMLAALAGGAINQLIDSRIDAVMARTQGRPLPSGRVKPRQAIIMSTILGLSGIAILFTLVNTMVAILSFMTLIGYAGVYTLFLKRATPQNIVIGGLAGAMPPLLGWVAVTGKITAAPLLLVLIIFTWTPPHFWALAIHRHKEYAKVNIPMLPVTHGLEYTRLNVLLYTVLMVTTTYLPFAINMSGPLYVVGISFLNAVFIYLALRLYVTRATRYALRTFHYSIFYLMMLFLVLLIDHYLPLLV
jgi:heme o synthase